MRCSSRAIHAPGFESGFPSRGPCKKFGVIGARPCRFLSPTFQTVGSKPVSAIANTHPAVYHGVTAFLDPTLPKNEGTFRAASIVAPLACGGI